MVPDPRWWNVNKAFIIEIKQIKGLTMNAMALDYEEQQLLIVFVELQGSWLHLLDLFISYLVCQCRGHHSLETGNNQNIQSHEILISLGSLLFLCLATTSSLEVGPPRSNYNPIKAPSWP